MNTKLLMTISAILLGIVGIVLTFLPQEISDVLFVKNHIVLQLLGGLYFGFAMLNWTAKANLIGGIYGRPVAIGNFSHFAIGGLAIIKPILNGTLDDVLWIAIGVIYLVFAALFGYVFFNHPKLKTKM